MIEFIICLFVLFVCYIVLHYAGKEVDNRRLARRAQQVVGESARERYTRERSEIRAAERANRAAEASRQIREVEMISSSGANTLRTVGNTSPAVLMPELQFSYTMSHQEMIDRLMDRANAANPNTPVKVEKEKPREKPKEEPKESKEPVDPINSLEL